MSIDRWTDKEVVVHIHNGILLSHKKEHIWVRSDEVDEPRTYTEWSESERERQILYSNTYIWDLGEWFWRIKGQQWRNRHREQTYGHGERGGEGEMYGKSNMETYITICKIESQREFAVWLGKLKQGLCIKLKGWDGQGVGREIQKGVDKCIPMTDSCWGLTENKKIL